MTSVRHALRSLRPQFGNLRFAFLSLALSVWLLCAYYWTVVTPGSYLVFTPGREASRLTLGVLIGLLVLSYWWLLRIRPLAFQGIRLSHILFGLSLLALPFFFLPPIASQDIYHSLFFGHAATRGLNPYQITLDTYPTGAFAGAVHGYFDLSAPWGPLWIDLVRASTGFFGTHAGWNIFFVRLVLLTALVGSIFLLRRCLPSSSRTKWILALTAWNPLLFYFTVGELHNDILVVVFLLGAVAFYRREWVALSAVCIGLAAAVKWFPMLFLPLLLFAVIRRPRTLRAVGYGALCAVAGLLCLVVLLLPYWQGSAPLHGVFVQSVAYSKPFFVEQLRFFLSSGGQGWIASGTALSVSAWASRALFLLLYLWILWRVLRGALDFPKAALWTTIVLLLFGLFWLVQWYALWLFPFALLTVRGAETLFQFSCFVIASFFMTVSTIVALVFLFLILWMFIARPITLRRHRVATG